MLSLFYGEIVCFMVINNLNACIVGGHYTQTRLGACPSLWEPVGHDWWDLGWAEQLPTDETASNCNSRPRLYLIAWLAEAIASKPKAGAQA